MRADKQPSKTQLYENNKLTSYIFQPSRGHFQADFGNILGSISTDHVRKRDLPAAHDLYTF